MRSHSSSFPNGAHLALFFEKLSGALSCVREKKSGAHSSSVCRKPEQCGIPMKIIDHAVNFFFAESYENCLLRCWEYGYCDWMTFDKNSNFCELFNTFDEPSFEPCDNCISSERSCHFSSPDCYQHGECTVSSDFDLSKLLYYKYNFLIPHLTDCFRKLNTGGAACLLNKISLKKRTLDFSM